MSSVNVKKPNSSRSSSQHKHYHSNTKDDQVEAEENEGGLLQKLQALVRELGMKNEKLEARQQKLEEMKRAIIQFYQNLC